MYFFLNVEVFLEYNTYNKENLWVDKLCKGELVYPKWYASQVHILQQSYREGLAVPYRLTPFTQQMHQSWPITLVCSYVSQFSLFRSRVLRTLFTHPSFLHKVARARCTKHNRITPLVHLAMRRQLGYTGGSLTYSIAPRIYKASWSDYRPTTLIYSPSRGTSR